MGTSSSTRPPHASRGGEGARGARLSAFRRAAGAAGLLLSSLWAGQALAIDFGALGKAADTVNKGQDAVTSGQKAVETGTEAYDKGRQMWDNRGNLVPGTSTVRGAAPSGPAPVSRDEGGTTRLIAVLGEGLSGAASTGKAMVGLLDRGVYFVQRQSAYSAPAQGQVLLAPRADTTTLSLDLPANPTGTVFDLAAGRSSAAGRGVRVYALSVHADVPQRRDRRALDAIEQHALLRASSVQMEWPRNPQDILEAVGGKLLVHASDAGVSFPSGFGVDGKLFTKDDPMVSLPRGYTVVTLDPRGFIFDRSREVVMPFHPVMPTAGIDLSRLSHADAFQAFCSLMSERYPYRDTRPLDWLKVQAEFAPIAAQAGDSKDAAAYARIYADIGQRLRDGQYRVRLPGGADARANLRQEQGLSPQYQLRGDFALPMPRLWLGPEGRGSVTDVAPNSAAALAGLRPGAEIVEVEGESLQRFVERTAPVSSRATEAARRLEASMLQLSGKESLRLLVRQEGREQNLELRRPRDNPPPPAEPPGQLEGSFAAYQLRSAKGNDFGYLAFNSFADSQGKLEAWERALASLSRARVPGLIVDLRGNSDSTYQLVAHFIASFFSYDTPLRPQPYAQRQLDPASKVWRTRGGLGLPPQLPLYGQDDGRYGGRVVLLTGRDCSGACELFAAWLQRAGRAHVVATEATAGGVGHTTRIALPGGVSVQVPVVSELTASGESYVDGKGVEPNLRVAVDRDFVNRLGTGGDPVLDAAVVWLDANLPPR
jgi:C-terminal processing protease CtpA/Prc